MAKPKPAAVTPRREVKAKQQTKASAPIPFAKYATWVNIILITIIFWTLYSTIFDHKPDMNGDNFAYMLLGKRFVAGWDSQMLPRGS